MLRTPMILFPGVPSFRALVEEESVFVFVVEQNRVDRRYVTPCKSRCVYCACAHLVLQMPVRKRFVGAVDDVVSVRYAVCLGMFRSM